MVGEEEGEEDMMVVGFCLKGWRKVSESRVRTQPTNHSKELLGTEGQNREKLLFVFL